MKVCSNSSRTLSAMAASSGSSWPWSGEPPGAGEPPAAAPPLLILVPARVALARPGLDVVEPDVLHPGAVGPGLLAGDRAGVAADALVEVHHHRHLCHDAHQ